MRCYRIYQVAYIYPSLYIYIVPPCDYVNHGKYIGSMYETLYLGGFRLPNCHFIHATRFTYKDIYVAYFRTTLFTRSGAQLCR